MPSIQNTDLLIKYSQRDLSNAGIPTTNLQGYWKFNGNANDESNNSYNLTASGSPIYTTGLFNSCVDLEASSSQYFSVSATNCNITTSQTWSCWIKSESAGSGDQMIMGIRNSGGGNNRGIYIVNSTARIRWDLDGLSSNPQNSPTTVISNGVWYHIACVYDSTNNKSKVFINGVKQELSTTGSPSAITGNFVVGRNGDMNQYYYDGLIDDVAIYNTSLTDEQILNIYNTGGNCVGYWKFDQTEDTNTKLLLHFNGADGATSTLDSSTGKAVTFVANAQIDTAQKKFGVSSLLLDGTGDYITLADSADWHFSNGNFTIDLWVRFNSTTGNQQLANQYVDANNFWTFYKNSNNGISFYVRQSSTDVVLMSTANSLVTTNTWYHIALVRDGSNCKIFIDGDSKALTGTDFGATSLNDLATTLKIGYLASGNEQELNGWIDEFRIVKGVAKYTANFTAPTSPYSFQTDDYSNNGYHLTTGTQPTNVSGLYEQAGDFESGSNHYIASSGSTSSLDSMSTFSISCWVNPESTLNYRAFVARWDSVGGIDTRSWFFGYGYLTDNRPALYVSSGGTDASATAAISDDAIPNGVYSHIVGTYDGSTIRLYVNGVLKKTALHTGVKASPNNRVSIGAVGGRSGDSPTSMFDGIIDDVAIFNRALTDDEILEIYKSFAPRIWII